MTIQGYLFVGTYSTRHTIHATREYPPWESDVAKMASSFFNIPPDDALLRSEPDDFTSRKVYRKIH